MYPGQMILADGDIQLTCDFVVIFERAVDLRMEIALHAKNCIKNVCLHRTPTSHLLITQKKLPSGKNIVFQNGQVTLTKIIAANITFYTIFVLSTSGPRCPIWMIY